MREIKFRVFDIDNKRMLDDGHKLTEEGTVTWVQVNAIKGKVIWLQYTGLKDKKGVEIYEGDILSIKQVHSSNEALQWFVIYHYGSFGVTTKEKHKVLKSCVSSNLGYTSFINFREKIWDNTDKNEVSEFIEVIGNIHQNPDLLNNQTKNY